jgi:hypothetical protein
MAASRSLAHGVADSDQDPTPSQLFGLALHDMLLGPEDADLYYMSEVDRRTTAGKAAWAAAEQSGRTVIPADIARAAALARSGLKDTPARVWGLQDALYAERVVEWQIDGHPCKARIDACGPSTSVPPLWAGNRLYELKTCRDARPRAFSADCARYGYIIQLAWYSRGLAAVGLEPRDTYIVAVENRLPYAAMCYHVSVAWLDLAQREIDRILPALWEAQRTGQYPAYDPAPIELHPPVWACNEEED